MNGTSSSDVGLGVSKEVNAGVSVGVMIDGNGGGVDIGVIRLKGEEICIPHTRRSCL
ncbi:MAG: hypothetical protein MUP21_01900 [Dehalococcoidia bacterium]|nr:hypothetical protein [Dehalococcoidia bacterium]